MGAEYAKLRKPVFVVLMGETDFRFRGKNPGVTVEHFKWVYRHIHSIWDKAGATNIAYVYDLACDQNPSDAEIERLYPGVDVVDYVGCSFYGRGNLQGAERLARWGKRHKKAFIVAESSANFVEKKPGIQRWANYFGTYFAFVAKNDVKVAQYNNIQNSAESSGTPVDSFCFMLPGVQAGWRREMEKPRYLLGDGDVLAIL
jgi:hypothetical protein